MAAPFDMDARRQRRDRAVRTGPETFLERRAMEDVLDRLAMMTRPFERGLMVGSLDPESATSLRTRVGQLTIVDPSALAASAVDGTMIEEADLGFDPGSFDLIVAAGTLANANELSDILLRFRFLLEPGGLLIGFVAGGDLLPRLRAAIAAADAGRESHVPRFHPRLDPGGLTRLLAASGLLMPVVDVDRIEVRYSSMADLLRDLRGMGATNVLSERSRKPISRAARSVAERAFVDGAVDGRTAEVVEILHFIGWSPDREGETKASSPRS